MFFLTSAYSALDADMDPQEVLNAMRGYIGLFFGCDECAVNFEKMATLIANEVRSPQSSVLFLWRAHNKANARLHGDVTEDPQHPKLQFPSKHACPECHVAYGDNWSDDHVYSYLLGLYGDGNIVQDGAIVEDNGVVKELNEEELELRRKDLNKLKQIKDEKQQKQINLLRDKMITTVPRDRNPKIALLQKREIDTRILERPTSFGFSGIDISLCVVFYIVCAVILLFLYFHFTVRHRTFVRQLCGIFYV